MDVLAFITLFITGFTSCAEFGSYAFVHPVIRKLPREHHVFVEKGLLKTFGRVMPVLMTLCVILSITYAIKMNKFEDTVQMFRWASALSFIVALATTIAVNVGINSATGKWDIDNPPANWKEIRNRWEFFQGVRSWLLLIGFVLLCVAMTLK
jgi:predicted membrane protein